MLAQAWFFFMLLVVIGVMYSISATAIRFFEEGFVGLKRQMINLGWYFLGVILIFLWAAVHRDRGGGGDYRSAFDKCRKLLSSPEAPDRVQCDTQISS